MKQKMKLLSVCKRKPKAENSGSWSKTVERYAPDTYDLLDSVGEKDTLKKVEEFHPEIVLVLSVMEDGNLKNGLRLVKEIRQLSFQSKIFVIFDMLDDEEEVFDEYIDCGAYKCYTSPANMDALFHDMYVALNME